jgi:hypothetical protein
MPPACVNPYAKRQKNYAADADGAKGECYKEPVALAA